MSKTTSPELDRPPETTSHAQAAREHVAKNLDRIKNYRGYWGTGILFKKEVDRFAKIAMQTIFSPALTTLLWFLVFGYSLGDRLREIKGIPYVDFLVPGLVMMAVIMNSFMNSGFSFFISKIHGAVTDLLVTPLSPLQIILGYMGASLARGLAVGGVIWATAELMGASTLFNVGFTFIFLVLTSLGFSLLGLIVGILARDFDHVNFIPSFLIMPLTFLGGVFYSIDLLPAPWDDVSRFNPILYMVNGLRYGMTGVTDVSVTSALTVAVLPVLFCLAIAYWILASGMKLRN